MLFLSSTQLVSLGEGNGNPLHYSFLGNPIDRGACWATTHGVQKVRHNLAAKQKNNNILNYGVTAVYAAEM